MVIQRYFKLSTALFKSDILCHSTSLSGGSVLSGPLVRPRPSRSGHLWCTKILIFNKERIWRMPIEAFKSFRYIGQLKHRNKVIANGGQLESVLKDALYRPERDSESLNLEKGKERVTPLFDSYFMTHIL